MSKILESPSLEQRKALLAAFRDLPMDGHIDSDILRDLGFDIGWTFEQLDYLLFHLDNMRHANTLLGLTWLLTEYGEKDFYWGSSTNFSHTQTPTTKNEL